MSMALIHEWLERGLIPRKGKHLGQGIDSRSVGQAQLRPRYLARDTG